MDALRWQKIEEIYNSALEIDAKSRVEFVHTACRDDLQLCYEVKSLLAETDAEDDFLKDSLLVSGLSVLQKKEEKSLVGEKIGRFAIIELLGQGGMGEVFLAEDAQLARRVALKVLPVFLTEDLDSVRRFRHEARAASIISHPNIAHIYETGETNNRYFIAMEYVAGETLRAFLKREQPDINQSLDIVTQIAEALTAAHGAGVIHRDIKPENIIVKNSGLIKILDFGLAKLSAIEDEKEAQLTKSFITTSGLIMGTVAYMSPEQIRARGVTFTTDIWSLGVVLYELLTGARPFEGETQGDSIASILRTEPLAPSALNAKIPAGLSAIVMKMLRKSADERYQTADALLADLNFQKKTDFRFNPLQFAARADKKTFNLKYLADFLNKHHAGFAAGVIVALIVAITGFWFFADYSGSNAPGLLAENAAVESVAVIPFAFQNNNSADDYLAEGITDSLISRLSQIRKLKVKSRNSVFQYKGKNVSAQIVGRELAVAAVLFGQIFENGDDLTLNLELVNAQNGNRLWGKHYQKKKSEIPALQNEISRDVSNALYPQLSAAEVQKLTKKTTENAQANDLYLRGRFHWNKRTAKDMQKSIDYFEQATALDPNFALAYAGLAESYVLASGYAIAAPQQSFPQAKTAAQRAIEIDETLAEAHNALAYALFNYDWNFAESEREIERAIELNPNYSTAYHWRGNANLLAVGKYEEAIDSLKKAQELDPLSLIINADLATGYLYARQFDRAVEQFQKTIEMDENFFYAHAYLGRTLLMKGDYAAALAELKKAQSLSNDPLVMMLSARTYAKMGRRDKALEMLAELEETARQKYVSAYYFALVYAGLGEKDRAFEWLEKALQDREGPMTVIKVDALLDDLRSDARFPPFLRHVGLDN